MRKGIFLIILIMCMCFGVSAVTGATDVSSFATVSYDGKCQMNLTATLHIEPGGEDLLFPVPDTATNITVNGSRVRTSHSGDTLVIDLSNILRNVTGDVSVAISYTLRDTVYTGQEEGLVLQIPLLCGFNYPISKMEFSITLPGPVTGRPTFFSGYHQTNIEKDLTYGIEGATIAGSFLTALKDHETLQMSLPVTHDMFPQSMLKMGDPSVIYQMVWICGGLALVYWLLFLRNMPPLGQYASTPPEGRTAGDMGALLCLRGLDLSLTMLTWAQLGYLGISLDRQGRVHLSKRMEMGNERREWERRWFSRMFSRRDTVDTTGSFYARLCMDAAGSPYGIRELMHPKSGNLRVFRGLVSGMGLLGGVILGMYLGAGAALQGLLIALLAVAGGIGGWYLQGWAYGLVLQEKGGLILGCAIAAVWLLVSWAAGCLAIMVWIVVALAVAGVLLAFGGRRTESGRQQVGQALGLRRYLRTVSKGELQRVSQDNPEYFFTLAPYAIALGAGKRFAGRFGGIRLPACPYLTTGMDDHMNATQWVGIIHKTVGAMKARSRSLPLERAIAFLRRMRR